MGMMLHRKSRRGNGILLRFGFLKTASFRRKMRSRRTKDCEKQGFGGQRHQQADAQKGTDVPCLQVLYRIRYKNSYTEFFDIPRLRGKTA